MRSRLQHAAWRLAAVAGAVSLSALAVATGIAQHDEPAARFVVAECQGFDALASAGSQRVSCEAPPRTCDADDAAPASGVTPVSDRPKV